MANVKISALPAAATLDGSEVVPIVQASATVQTTTQDIADLGGASFANPTASLGLAAVNGVATTAMRSDAAPALSQSIAPTWSGLHNFTGGIRRGGLDVGYLGFPTIAISGTGDYTLSATDNGKQLYRTAATEQDVVIPLNATVPLDIGFAVQLANRDTTGTGKINVTRAGGVTVFLAGTTTNDDYELEGVNLATLTKVDTNTWILWVSVQSGGGSSNVVNQPLIPYQASAETADQLFNVSIPELTDGQALKIDAYGTFANFGGSGSLTMIVRLAGASIMYDNTNVAIPATTNGTWNLDMEIRVINDLDGDIYYNAGVLTVYDASNGDFLGSMPIYQIGIGVQPGDMFRLNFSWGGTVDVGTEVVAGSILYLTQ